MTPIKQIHLIGICGTAMASLAGMLAERGFTVTGSDAAAYPPMSDFLASLGIPVSQPFAIENLNPTPDPLVIDTAFFDKGLKFLHYFPDAAILTSVEFEHAVIYKDLDAVETAFKRLVNLVPRRGKIVAFDRGESVERCISRALCPVEHYGTGSESDWRIADLKLKSDQTSWSVIRNGQKFAGMSFALAGEYNVWNATAAVAIAAHHGIQAD